jgi:hypothetical protein
VTDTDATRWFASLPPRVAAFKMPPGTRKVSANGRAQRWRFPDGSEASIAKRLHPSDYDVNRYATRWGLTFYAPADRTTPTHTALTPW